MRPGTGSKVVNMSERLKNSEVHTPRAADCMRGSAGAIVRAIQRQASQMPDTSAIET